MKIRRLLPAILIAALLCGCAAEEGGQQALLSALSPPLELQLELDGNRMLYTRQGPGEGRLLLLSGQAQGLEMLLAEGELTVSFEGIEHSMPPSLCPGSAPVREITALLDRLAAACSGREQLEQTPGALLLPDGSGVELLDGEISAIICPSGAAYRVE